MRALFGSHDDSKTLIQGLRSASVAASPRTLLKVRPPLREKRQRGVPGQEKEWGRADLGFSGALHFRRAIELRLRSPGLTCRTDITTPTPSLLDGNSPYTGNEPRPGCRRVLRPGRHQQIQVATPVAATPAHAGTPSTSKKR